MTPVGDNVASKHYARFDRTPLSCLGFGVIQDVGRRPIFDENLG